MKLKDIPNNIDKSEKNTCWIDTEAVGHELNITVPYIEQDRLKAYWISHWHCTDTYVGKKIYFLDDVPVAFSSQKGRKWDEIFYWVNEEAAKAVRAYLLTLFSKEEDELNLRVCDLEEDIGETYQVEFNAQIISTDRITYKGQPVKLLEKMKNSSYGIHTLCKIELPGGATKEVEVLDLDFHYHFKKEVNQ